VAEDEDEVELREHILIFSGFLGASSLTGLVFIISFGSAFSKIGNVATALGILGLSLLLSIFAGLAVLFGFHERRYGHEGTILTRLAELLTIFGAICLVAIIPLFIAPFSTDLFIFLNIILAVLIASVFVVIYWSRNQE
jgi:hypothetical protein